MLTYLQNRANPGCIILWRISVAGRSYQCSNGEKLKVKEWNVLVAEDAVQIAAQHQ